MKPSRPLRIPPTATVVIPARLQSKRLPEKVLLDETGKPLIRYAIEAARQCQFVKHVVVATDSMKVASAVSGLAAVWLESDDSWCGTQRAARALVKLPPNYADTDVIVNWQADEPQIEPTWTDNLICHVSEYSNGMKDDPLVWTMCGPLSPRDARRPDAVKAVTCQDPIDNYEVVEDFCRTAAKASIGLRHHIGIYAMRPEQLAELVSLPPSVRSIAESLEQLTWIDAGWKMATTKAPRVPLGINTPDDYRRFCMLVDKEEPEE